MHIHCPHCHNPIEVIDAAPEEVLCPSCGSSFRLELAATTVQSPSANQGTVGKFVLMETLGMGAFGTVYKARDPELDRVVAVKVPRPGNVGSGDRLDRFLREARSVAQLRHPSIVPVHEVGHNDGLPYLVSEFIAGVTLADWLTAHCPIHRQAAELIVQLADALQYAHSQGVVHRDIKPSNILLETAVSEDLQARGASKGEHALTPRLTDFGLAKRDAGEIAMTVEGQVLGTPAYMSPEQARGTAHTVDGRSDVYSLGVILYELLTGELPFRGNVRMLLHQVLHDEPRPPRRLDDHIPRDLETICLKAMAKEPGRRYQTAGELRDDLRRYLDGQPILARPVSRMERAVKWVKRHPATAAVYALLVLVGVLGVGGGGFGWLWQQAENARRQAENAGADATAARQDEARAKEALALALDQLEQHSYIHHINLVQRDWEAAEVVRARQLLAGCEEKRRGWEWYYLDRLTNPELLVFASQSSFVTSVAFSPDGQRVASASYQYAVKVWDAAGGKEQLTLEGHTGGVMSVAFSPDGRRLASASADKTVKVWDATTGKELLTLTGHTNWVWGVAFSPDGRRLASGSQDKTVKVWDANNGKELLSLNGDASWVTSVAFHPDGRRLASAGYDRTVKVWDVTSGKVLLTLEGHTEAVVSVAFSPDGGQLASASQDRTVKVWDAASGKELLTMRGHTGEVRSVAFSPDGQRLASASKDKTLKLWDAANGDELLTLAGHANGVSSIAFSPDGHRLVSGGWDFGIRIWDLTRSKELLTLDVSGDGIGGS